MSSLLKIVPPLKQLARPRPAVIYNVARKYADYRLEELIPGNYPKSKKEREEAARKYNLLPQEYEAIPDDGDGRGDYPNLPTIGGDARGHWYPWDYPEHRKDFNDPWHIEEDLMQTDRSNPNEEFFYPMWQMWLMQLGTIFGVVGLFFFFENFKFGPPVMKKQYPTPGRVNYTFEPALD